jgi:hypothetical protein
LPDTFEESYFSTNTKARMLNRLSKAIQEEHIAGFQNNNVVIY